MLEMNTDLTEITVVGHDNTGLLAEITSLLFEHEINVEELDRPFETSCFG